MAIRLFHLTEFADSAFLSPQAQREAMHPLLATVLASLWLVLATNLPLWFFLMRGAPAADRPDWLGPTLAAQMVLALCAGLALLPWRRALKPVLIALLLLAALNTHLLLKHGVFLDGTALQRALGATWPEVRAFVGWQLLATVLVLGVMPTFLLWRQPLRRRSFWQCLWQNALCVAVCAGLLWVWQDPGTQQYMQAQRALLTPFNSLLALAAASGLYP